MQSTKSNETFDDSNLMRKHRKQIISENIDEEEDQDEERKVEQKEDLDKTMKERFLS